MEAVVDVPNPIERGFYLGSARSAEMKESLQALNVTHVLIVARSLQPLYPADFTYKKIKAVDAPTQNLWKHFKECFEFIDEARRSGGGVLVHCFAGVSRSATIVIAYMMNKHGLNRSHATTLIRTRRRQIKPNPGFVKQLDLFEKLVRLDMFKRVIRLDWNVTGSCIVARSGKEEEPVESVEDPELVAFQAAFITFVKF